MDTLGPDDGCAEHFNILGDSSFHIDNYVGSLTNLPTSLAMSDGRDALELLGFKARLTAATDHVAPYIRDVDPAFRILRDTDVPACRDAFSAFAAASASCTDLAAGSPLSDATRTFLVTRLPDLQAPISALAGRLNRIASEFGTFHDNLPDDMKTLADLANLFKPDDPDHLADGLGLSGDDRVLVESSLSQSAPTLGQDAHASLGYADNMRDALSRLSDMFGSLGAKVESTLAALGRAEAQGVPACLERVWIDAARRQWEQLAAFIARIGF